jgi:hypothetical protein
MPSQPKIKRVTFFFKGQTDISEVATKGGHLSHDEITLGRVIVLKMTQ